MPTQAERDLKAKRARNRAKLAKARAKVATGAISSGKAVEGAKAHVKKQMGVIDQSRKELATLDKLGAASGPKPTTTTPKTTTTKPVTTTTKPTVTAPTPAPVDTFKAPGGQDFSYADDFVFTTDDTGAVFVNDIEGFKRASRNSPFDFFISKSGKLTDKQGNPIDQFGKLISSGSDLFGSGSSSGEHGSLDEFLDGIGSDRDATDSELVNRGLFSEFDIRARELAREQGIDIDRQPETYAQLVRQAEEEFRRKKKHLSEDIARQAEADSIALHQVKVSAEGSAGAASAALAQDREGPMSQSAPFALDVFEKTLQQNVRKSVLSFEQSQANRLRAMEDLERAKKSKDKDLIDLASAALGRAEMAIEKSQTDLLNAQTAANNQAIKLQESTIATLDTLGAGTIAGMQAEDIAASFAEVGLNPMMGRAFHANSVRIAAAEAIGDEQAVEKAKLDNLKIQAELNNTLQGATTAQKDWNFLNMLKNGGMAGVTNQDILDFKRLSNIAPNALSPLDDARRREIEAKLREGKDAFGYGDASVASEYASLKPTQSFNTPIEYSVGSTTPPGTHGGIDIVLPGGQNADVRAVAGGVASIFSIDNGQGTGWGNSIEVVDNDGRIHRYSHLSSVDLFDLFGEDGVLDKTKTVGIVSGEVLGKQGNTGFSFSTTGGDGTHLDYRIIENGQTIDPEPYLKNLQATSGELSPLAQSVVDGVLTLKDLTPTQRAELAPELNSIGFKSAITGEMKHEVESIQDGLQAVLSALDKVPSGHKGSIEGRFSTLIASKERVPEIAAFDTQAKIVGMQITRLFEKGRISDADREFYLSLMPNLNQSDEAAKISAQNVIDRLNSKIDKIQEVGLLGDSDPLELGISSDTEDPLDINKK